MKSIAFCYILFVLVSKEILSAIQITDVGFDYFWESTEPLLRLVLFETSNNNYDSAQKW